YNEDLIIGWFGHEHVIQRGTYQKFIDAVVPPSSADLLYIYLSNEFIRLD
ncbi:unnamed protein product, partial [Adineta steineri]